MPTRSTLRSATIVALSVGAFVLLTGFVPFTPVKNVCPRCKRGKSDVVVLTAGARIRCTVVAQNTDYYVLEKHGEYRAVAKTEVSSVEWHGGAETTKPPQDQVILKNGHVLHGRLLQVTGDRYVILRMGNLQYIAFFTQIKAIYKNGVLAKYSPKP